MRLLHAHRNNPTPTAPCNQRGKHLIVPCFPAFGEEAVNHSKENLAVNTVNRVLEEKPITHLVSQSQHCITALPGWSSDIFDLTTTTSESTSSLSRARRRRYMTSGTASTSDQNARLSLYPSSARSENTVNRSTLIFFSNDL